jgi:phenylacetaldehyde dehydrogenase
MFQSENVENAMNSRMKVYETQVASFLSSCGRLLINGQHVDAASGETFEVEDPATENVIARVARAGDADVDAAVSAARKAFDGGAWHRLSPAARARLIHRLGDAIEEHADELALLETLDNGKPLAASRGSDIPVAIDRLHYYAGWATKIAGSTPSLSLAGDWHAYTLREPVGVVALIVPWNFPLTMAVSKIAPALAAGCTVILKPAEQTPLTALKLGELVNKVGLPPGVVNILTGFGDTGAALVRHAGVDKVSFTGSTAVGKEIVKAATGNLKRVTLELGGKSPVIVFPDADLDKTIDGVSRFIFSNAGQVCAAGSRLYAHQKVYDRVLEGIAAKAKTLKVGAGIDATTEMGPLVSKEQLARVKSYIDSGQSEGATRLGGDGALPEKGYFVSPSILADTTPEMRVRREEIFGPVLCAAHFDDDTLDEIAAEANNSEYGLAAYVWTQNLSTAHKIARRLKAGTVRINGGAMDNALPFGGYKQSGWGRENAQEGLDAFLEVKSVQINL